MRGLLGKILVGVLLVIMVLEIGALGFMGFKIVRGESPRQLAEKGKTDGQPPANDGADNSDSSDSGSLNDVVFEKHAVTSGIGDNYLFDIAVGYTTKDVMNSVSSDDLTAFLSGIDFTGTSGNAVLMFEDGTGLSIMESDRTYFADYGYIDVSEGEFTMVDRLGSIWNDTGDGWYYKTVAEMRAADNAGENTLPESNDKNLTVSLESVSAIIKGILSENYSDCDVSYDESGITANIWSDGIAMAVTYIQETGGDASNADWVTAKNGMVTLAKSLRNLMDTCGQSDALLVINLLNDLNHDNVLLTLVNDAIFYDVLA